MDPWYAVSHEEMDPYHHNPRDGTTCLHQRWHPIGQPVMHPSDTQNGGVKVGTKKSCVTCFLLQKSVTKM